MNLKVAIAFAAIAVFAFWPHQAKASVFCRADVGFMTPWDFSKDAPSVGDTSLHYFFTLKGDEPATVSGDMIVVTDNKAYTVPFKDVQIVRSMNDPKDFESDATFLALPQSDAIRYAWVDDVTDATGKLGDCPTFPYHVEALSADDRAQLTPSNPHPLTGPYVVPALQAQFKMDLPPVHCAKPYADVKPLDSIADTYGFYDPSVTRTPHVEGRVDVDSDGKAVNVELTKPSGAVAVDAYVREWYMSAHYQPAMFRCIGVVSSYWFQVTLEGR